jgi:formate dehydrogenase beta subunit
MNEHAKSEDVGPKRPGGAGKGGRARRFPKGRQVDAAATAEIRELLRGQTLRRDLLIEFLHLIQDKWGHISAARLAALAAEMRLPQAEVYEVATFYHHFDVVKEMETAPPEVTIRVCDSLSCALAGAERLIEELKTRAPDSVRVLHAPCMGQCEKAPAAAVGHNYVGHVSVDGLLKLAGDRQVTPQIPAYQSLQDYREERGYEALGKLRTGGTTPDELIDVLLEAGLRGLGGAGFPSGQKWKFVRAGSAPRYLCINADEGEPGTFKDRFYLETKPHQFLEGMLIAAWGVGAEACYIYLRDEYPAIRQILLKEIEVLERAGHRRPRLHRPAPRRRRLYLRRRVRNDRKRSKASAAAAPPPALCGPGRPVRPPTLVQNVETMYWIRDVIEKGPTGSRPRAAGAQGLPQLFRFGPGEAARA